MVFNEDVKKVMEQMIVKREELKDKFWKATTDREKLTILPELEAYSKCTELVRTLLR